MGGSEKSRLISDEISDDKWLMRERGCNWWESECEWLVREWVVSDGSMREGRDQWVSERENDQWVTGSDKWLREWVTGLWESDSSMREGSDGSVREWVTVQWERVTVQWERGVMVQWQREWQFNERGEWWFSERVSDCSVRERDSSVREGSDGSEWQFSEREWQFCERGEWWFSDRGSDSSVREGSDGSVTEGVTS